MDALAKMKEEVEKKKRLMEAAGGGADAEAGASAAKKPKKTYMTNGQLKKMESELKVRVSGSDIAGADKDSEVLSPEQKAAQTAAETAKKKVIPKEEVIKRLRANRQPITLFGESDDERLARLRHVELTRPDEENEGTAGQQNFMHQQKKKEQQIAADGDSSDEDDLSPEEKKAKKQRRLAKLRQLEAAAQNKQEKIRSWLKRVLKEWEMDVDELPDYVISSVKGRQEVNSLKQTKNYLKPLLRKLKRRELEQNITEKLVSIIQHCNDRKYNKAADEYLILSIGKAAWPMGVTMVGIHERSAREKIFSQDVAHILNDETQRKYIQSVKRLMTYSQNKYPPDSFCEALEPTAIDTRAPTMLKMQGKGELTGILANKHTSL
mmetsp:Transcript_3340/g.7883  ORF Transcript_3340/g.7883 Transcript_3340/m.7883 type:complete len:379 (-) Transcript_3340:352-1488(-)